MKPLKLTYVITAAVIGLSLMGCASTTNQAQVSDAASAAQAATPELGQPYAQITGGVMPSRYGPAIAQETLPSGQIVYKHAISVPASTARARVFGGTAPASEGQGSGMDLKLSYFRVGSAGTISGFASGLISGQRVNCISLVGTEVSRCNNASQFAAEIAQMDAAVTTSDARSYLSWKAAPSAAR